MTRIPGFALASAAAVLASACSTAMPGPPAPTAGGTSTVAGLGSGDVSPGTDVPAGTPASGASRSVAPPSPTSPSPVVGDGAVAAGGTSCGPADVAITQGAAEGAAGSVFVAFTIRNTSGSPCVTGGYPVLELADDQGPLPTTLTREPSDAPSSVTLAPQGSARFVVAFSKVPQGNEDCPAVTRLAVTLPGAGSAADVPVQDVAPCGGQLRVRPVQSS